VTYIYGSCDFINILFPVLKIKLSCYHHVGAKGERKYSSYSFLTSTLDGMSGKNHVLAMLYPQEWTPGTHWIGYWVGLRAGLDTEAR
jgi:hypothetical protein